MLDGTRLRQSWHDALEGAQSNFRQLLTSPSSNEWRRINLTTDSQQSNGKGKARATAIPQPSDVMLHRRTHNGETVYRAVLDVFAGDDPNVSLDACKSVLATPELRKEWDPAVEGAQLLEMFDQATRISKTNFSLGWPASPRDAVTISRMFSDATTLIDISTSLPRSPDEPAYLRPSPPYVRSEVALFAWCIQVIQPQPQASTAEQSTKKPCSRIRITCFWQHDLRAMWSIGASNNFAQQLSLMMVGFFKTVKNRGARIPILTGYGNGVSMARVRFDIDREALAIDYSIVPEEEDHASHSTDQGLEELHTLREHRRLTRSIECLLPSSEGWDVRLSVKASSEEVSRLPWTAHATRSRASPSEDKDKIVFNVKHASLPNDHSVLKVSVVIELSGPSSGIRLNGIPHAIEELEERDPSSYFMSQQMLQDASSTADVSFRTQSTLSSAATGTSSTSTMPERPPITRTASERSAAAEKTILSRVKRSYIYFSSLLQEPEAKWRRTSEARGVSIAQLDSIDPTLVVYRAEATFVGLGLWDLYAAVVSPGARAHWDKLYDDSVLLEDVNQLSELWHFKTKPAWPVTGRDSVVLKTVYKSPTTIHVFAFSADDPNLFPNIPPVDPNVIRTQVDLQGWAIEALSPNTTLLTLLEQSDPKGWTNKTSIPQQMITAVNGIGDYAIKCGGPPIVTRLEGAKANEMRYDHEKGSFRIEYEGSASRRATSTENGDLQSPTSPMMPVIECELRCDLDNWASSLDIVVDPPPQTITCLRRHRFSSAGGGLWITITHDAVHAGDERLLLIVRKAPVGVAKEKGLVMVNGAKVDVDVEEMPEREAKNLAKKKRIKPARIPLDQPPVAGVIRRRRAELDAEPGSGDTENPSDSPQSPVSGEIVTTSPKYATMFGRYWTYAMEQATVTTQQAVAAISPAMAGGTDAAPSSSKPPMQYALEALSHLRDIHSHPNADGWTLVSDKGFPIHRKVIEGVSSAIPVHRGEKVIEGVSSEEVASVLSSYDCRKQWDTRFDSVHVLESYGAEAHAAFVVTKGGFPFRDRGFYLASLTARATAAASSSRRAAGEIDVSTESRSAIFCVSASFSPDSVASFSPSKYNPYALPVGRVFIDGWILETLDPYTAENYTIPSTRCTRVVAVDYAGSLPAAVNSMINGLLPRSVLAVETYVKGISAPPFTRLPAASLAVLNNADDEVVGKSWTLRKRDSIRTLVSADYVPGDRIYRSTVLLDFCSPRTGTLGSSANDQTPRPSKINLNTKASIPAEDGQSTGPNESAASPTASPPGPASGSIRSRSRDAFRSSSSMFTTRGEVRHPTDLLVSEFVIDSKLYPEGYTVHVRSRIDKAKAILALPLPMRDLPSDNVLPISNSVFTLPPSPHHSSGLNVDRPPRHLLRLSLPTAQYQVSTIQDPLTGETRTAPPKPQWLLDLEEGRAVVNVEIKPSASPSKGERAKSTQTIVTVDGVAASIVSEKASLTQLGREELLESRTSKMDALVSVSGEEDSVPKALQMPIARAEHLLDASAAAPSPAAPVSPSEPEGAASQPEDQAEAIDNRSQQGVPASESPPADTAASGLLRFLNTYSNPLFRFNSASSRLSPTATTPSVSAASSRRVSRTGKEIMSGTLVPGDAVALLSPGRTDDVRSYPLSTVVVVALIAFLVGSLLRSLLSPADFIYVVSDLKDAEHVSSGWREIKRLLEVKYIVGGWDFQVAVVRRN